MQRQKTFLLIVAFSSSVSLTGCTWIACGSVKKTELCEAGVERNMKLVQKAAEDYANAHLLKYPTEIDQFKDRITKPESPSGVVMEGDGLVNPFTTKYDNPFNGKITVQCEWPERGTIVDIQKARSGEQKALKPGTIEYNATPDRQSYAIIGGGADGKQLHAWENNLVRSSKLNLVLSNQ